MKKALSLLLVAIFIFGLTGCGNKESENIEWGEIREDTSEYPGDNQAEETVEEIISEQPPIIEEPSEIIPEEPIEETSEESRPVLIDTMENNLDETIILNKLSINDIVYQFPFAKTDVQTLTTCPFATSYIDTDILFFEGRGWGIQSDPNDISSFNGTTIFFRSDETDTFITGATISTFWDKGDLNIIFADFIKLGTPRTDVEAKLGTGLEESDSIIYKNNSGILILEYEDDFVEDVVLIAK